MAMKQERTKQKIQTLSRYIIEKAECDSYRAGTRSKQWHIEADQKLLDAVGGRSVLLRQAGELETDRELEKPRSAGRLADSLL